MSINFDYQSLYDFFAEIRNYSIFFWLTLPVHSGSLKRTDYPKQLSGPSSFFWMSQLLLKELIIISLLAVSITDSSSTKFVFMMMLGWPWPILQQGQLWSSMCLNGGNLSQFSNGKHMQGITTLFKKIHRVRIPTTCICKNKDADQLRGNHATDQRLCFGYLDSTIPLLPKSTISSL